MSKHQMNEGADAGRDSRPFFHDIKTFSGANGDREKTYFFPCSANPWTLRVCDRRIGNHTYI